MYGYPDLPFCGTQLCVQHVYKFFLQTLFTLEKLSPVYSIREHTCSVCRVAAGVGKGFAVANFLVKRLVLVHATVQPDGQGARSFNRYSVTPSSLLYPGLIELRVYNIADSMCVSYLTYSMRGCGS